MKYIFTILATVLIFAAVLWPSSHIPDTKWPVDKVIHFTMFLGWTAAFCYEVSQKWFVALIAGLLMALASELVQIPLDGRSFDTMDLLADGAGVLVGVANAPFLVRITKKILRRQ